MELTMRVVVVIEMAVDSGCRGSGDGGGGSDYEAGK